MRANLGSVDLLVLYGLLYLEFYSFVAHTRSNAFYEMIILMICRGYALS